MESVRNAYATLIVGARAPFECCELHVAVILSMTQVVLFFTRAPQSLIRCSSQLHESYRSVLFGRVKKPYLYLLKTQRGVEERCDDCTSCAVLGAPGVIGKSL